MRTLFFILPFIFITTGCIKQNTEKSDILTTEDIAKFDSLFNAWEKEIHSNPKAQLSSSHTVGKLACKSASSSSVRKTFW